MTALLGLFSLTKLLSVLGLGGAGTVAHLLGWTKKVPRWAWITLAVVIALIAAYLFHRHEVHQYKVEVQRAQMATDNDHWKQKLAAAHNDAIKWKRQYETAQTTIANQERTRHEETVRNNAAISSALLVRGPGAASSHCGQVNRPISSSSASGHEQAAPATPAAGSPVPADDWATVSWKWLVQVVQEHDDVISEAQAWRSQHERDVALHAQQTGPVGR